MQRTITGCGGRRRRLIFIASLLPVACVACVSAVPDTQQALLRVSAVPENASVYVNDVFVGSARVLAIKPRAMQPGVKYLTIMAPGYFPHDLRLDLPSGTTSVNIKLRPIPP